RLVVRVRIELDDGNVGGQRTRDVPPEKLARADDQVQNPAILGAAPVKGGRDRVADSVDHAGHAPAQLPPGRNIGQDRSADRDLNPAEGAQGVGPPTSGSSLRFHARLNTVSRLAIV